MAECSIPDQQIGAKPNTCTYSWRYVLGNCDKLHEYQWMWKGSSKDKTLFGLAHKSQACFKSGASQIW